MPNYHIFKKVKNLSRYIPGAPRPFPDLSKPASNSPSAESLTSSEKAAMSSASAPVHLSTSLLCLSTLLLRFCVGFGASGECGEGQQEELDSSEAHSVGSEERNTP